MPSESLLQSLWPVFPKLQSTVSYLIPTKCNGSFTMEDMIENIIPALLLQVTNNDTAKRHGSILAIAELVFALDNFGKTLSAQIVSQIR
jgi:hypothetical protein